MTYPIPPEALDDRLAWTGTSGSGKTYNAGVGVEKLLYSGARVVVVDPLDVWWGLRLTPDGKRASQFQLPIFGGAHGDLPVNEHAGALIGEAVATMRESCIVSLGGFPTKAAERRFMLAFLTALYRHTPGEPLHLILDESDLWAPQQILDKEGDAMKLKGQMEQIVRRGRVRGFIPWLITQRPAVLSKDVLSQADGLIAFKLTSSQDRDAIGAWIEGQADRAQGKEILASLPTMQQGQGVVWVPGRGILTTATFPEKATFDSSRTPKRGEAVRQIGAKLTPIDLGALKERLSTVEAEAKANDPKALKAEIARLQKELAAKPAGDRKPDQAELNTAEAAGFQHGYQQGLVEGERRGNIAGQALALTRVRSALDGLKVDEPPEAAAPRPAPQATPGAPPRPKPAPRPPTEANGTISGPQRKVLEALAFWASLGIPQPTRTQVGGAAGYSPSSGGFANLLGTLRTAGMIDYPAPGAVCLTDEGRAHAPQPDDRSALDRVNSILTNPQQRVLGAILRAAGSREEIADATGYSATSGGFANLLGSLRSLGLVDYPGRGQVSAAEWLQ